MASPPHTAAPAGFDPSLVRRLVAQAVSLPMRPVVFAITGLQGSGKSTLAGQMAALAKAAGILSMALSIDDFYLGRRERRELARRVHPLLAQRGPPGSHDVALACRTLDALRTMQPGEVLRVPRFDKLADTRLPPSRWTPVRQRPDLIFFEGWLLGVQPQAAADLYRAVNAFETRRDPDGRWRAWCNRALADYAPLWARLDHLAWLKGPGFDIVGAWRWQQEQTLQAARPRCAAMSREQVDDFVQAFERISRHAQATLAGIVDGVIELDALRHPVGATGGDQRGLDYRPGRISRAE